MKGLLKMMNKFKFLLTTLLLFHFVLSFPTLALAANLNIDCPAPPTICTKSGVDLLFTSVLDGFWYPGKTMTKTLNLKNSSPETRGMAIKGERTSPTQTSILENVMQVSIVPTGGGPVLWAGSVAAFYGKEKIDMGTFDPAVSLDYNFTVRMDLTAGDDYQNKKTAFDLTLGFWGEPVPTATPTPTVAPGPTATPAPGGGGGGAVFGAGVSAPLCNDTKPGSAPTLTSAVAGVNRVTLSWTEGSDPITYYLITYGTAPGVQSFGNPNVGGKGTTTYTVNNLSGGVTYYFVVRAGNGCMPGDFSNERAQIPLGGGVAGPAVGFLPGVLGEAITPSPTLTLALTPVVLGIQEYKDQYYWWWIPLVITTIVLVLCAVAIAIRKRKV